MHIPFLPVFILFLLCVPAVSQDQQALSVREIKDDAEEKYGPIPDLVCGELYRFPYRFAAGDPFYDHSGSKTASVRVMGKTYEGQKIRFDIYRQLVVLESEDRQGAPRSIILGNEWLDEFSLGEILFKKFPPENGPERFGQVIFEGETTCFYFWSKRYVLDSEAGGSRYSFSDPIRQAFIQRNGTPCPYAGKRSFLKCFPVEERLPVRAYLRENRIRVRKALDPEMYDLMEFINRTL